VKAKFSAHEQSYLSSLSIYPQETNGMINFLVYFFF